MTAVKKTHNKQDVGIAAVKELHSKQDVGIAAAAKEPH